MKDEKTSNSRFQRFEELPIWKLSKVIAVEVYKMTSQGRFAKDFVFRDQMRRAALSISSNIAEGFESSSHKGFVRYLYIAKASAGELRSQLNIAKELEFEIAEPGPLNSDLESVSRQISGFIRSLRENDNRKR